MRCTNEPVATSASVREHAPAAILFSSTMLLAGIRAAGGDGGGTPGSTHSTANFSNAATTTNKSPALRSVALGVLATKRYVGLRGEKRTRKTRPSCRSESRLKCFQSFHCTTATEIQPNLLYRGCLAAAFTFQCPDVSRLSASTTVFWVLF